MVLTAGAAMARVRSHTSEGLSRAPRMLTWLAAILLLAAAVVDWSRSTASPALAPRLFLVAAIVAPAARRRRQATRTGDSVLAAAAVVLAGSGLVGAWVSSLPGLSVPARAQQAVGGLGNLVAAVAAGLGIRCASRAIARAAEPALEDDGSPAAVYALLTAFTGLLTLPNLWTRGIFGSGTPAFAGIASAFLVWSAVWLFPRERRVGYASLVAGAALWLLWVALALS